MKNCYSLLVVMLLGLFGFSASAKNSVITVTPGSSAILERSDGAGNFSKVLDLTPGEHPITVNDYLTYRVSPADGHTITSFVNDSGTDLKHDNSFKQYDYVEFYYFTLSSTYTLTTKPTADLEHKSFTINIDKVPSNLKCRMATRGTELPLKPGRNDFTYIEEIDDVVQIYTEDFSEICSVKVNGIEEKPNFTHYITLKDGMEIDILTEFSDNEISYALVYEDERDFFTQILADGKPVTITNNSFRVPHGSRVECYNTNGQSWYIEHITMPSPNGGMITYKGDYDGYPYTWQHEDQPLYFTARENGVITVKAHKMKDYSITFHVNGRNLVKVLNGDNYTGTPIEGITEGESTIKLHEASTRVTIMPVDESAFLSPVTYRPSPGADIVEAYYLKSLNYWSITQGLLKDGAEIYINASTEATTIEMTVNLDNPDDVKLYTYYDPTGYYEPTEITGLKAGANTIAFPETSSKLYIKAATPDSQISSVKYRESADAEPVDATYESWYDYYEIASPAAGSFIDIESIHIDRDSKCVIYVDDTAAAGGVEIVTPTGSRTLTMSTGYNTVTFDADENGESGFTLRSKSLEGRFTVYVNDTPLSEGVDAEKRTATIRLADGDIIRLYTTATEFGPYNVSFDTFEGYSLTDVTTDIDTPADPSAPFTVLHGTRVSFRVEAPAGEEPYAAIGRRVLEPGDDGRFAFDITFDTPFTIGKQLAGITTISRDSLDADAAYFDLTGRRVAADRVAAGIYIRVAADGTATKIAVK